MEIFLLVWLTRLVFATAEIEAEKESEAHKYAVSAPEKPCFGGQKRLFGSCSVLVRLANNACVAREQCLFGSSGMLVAEENRAFRLGKQRFRPSETLSFFYFKCPYFAIALYLRRMRKIASVFSDGWAVGRKYRILGGLAMQSVKMSTVGRRRARWADGCRRAVEKKLLIAGTAFGGNTYLCSSPTGERS